MNLPVMITSALVGWMTAWVARRRGRNFWRWWVYGTVLPVIALVHSLFLGRPGKEAR
jgi:hypothetical protein